MTLNINTADIVAAIDAKKKGILPKPIAKRLGVLRTPIPELHDACVKCERGGENLRLWACHEYRRIVCEFRPAFFLAVTNGEKRKIVLSSTEELEMAGLQLIRKFKENFQYLDNGRYYFLNDKKIYSKCIQLIRDGKPGTGKNKAVKAAPKAAPKAARTSASKAVRKAATKKARKVPRASPKGTDTRARAAATSSTEVKAPPVPNVPKPEAGLDLLEENSMDFLDGMFDPELDIFMELGLDVFDPKLEATLRSL